MDPTHCEDSLEATLSCLPVCSHLDKLQEMLGAPSLAPTGDSDHASLCLRMGTLTLTPPLITIKTQASLLP